MANREEHHETGYDTKTFVYKGKEYTFRYDCSMTKGKGGKAVHFGCFPEAAPGNLQTNIKYCLKEITASNPTQESCAASRECYELLDYSGDHLRQILLRNDKANEVVEELRKNNRLQNTVTNCMVIEPYYYSTRKYFEDCAQYSAAFRLNLVLQYALGSQEMSSVENKVQDRPVMAIRDLKAENGVVEDLGDGKVRIRLVDFASIWLETRKITGTKVAGNGTMLLPLSPENTCLENVTHDFKISEKTDVYGLGMLLASLFLRHNGKYVNPNEQWLLAKDLWHDYSAPEIARQLRVCYEKYDKNAMPPMSWIECDLKAQHGTKLVWENMKNQDALYRIRNLFWGATRINPDNRISRIAFIKEIETIQKLVENQAEQPEPVNIYLFNKAKVDQHVVSYQIAAANAFMADQVEAVNEGMPIPQALCLAYGNPQSGKASDQLMQLGENFCTTREELSGSIDLLKPSDVSEQDYLLYGILRAFQILRENKQAYFAGKVYLFTPQIPTLEQMAPISRNNQKYGLVALCGETLEAAYQREAMFTVFSAQAPQTPPDWCEWKILRVASRDFSQKEQPAPEQYSTNEYAGRTFDTTVTAPYIKLPDGKRAYIRIKR